MNLVKIEIFTILADQCLFYQIKFLLEWSLRCDYTANVYSSITDKLMHLFVASTLKCLFWDFLELCDNYRQISVELPNNKNTQRKNWENFETMKKISQNYRQISVISAKSDYFQLDSAVVII